MLARRLPGVPVLVAEDRYLAGRLAECHLNCTVHLLDDGFQHLRLTRAIDLVVLSRADLDRSNDAGREALEAAGAADALLLQNDVGDRVEEVRHRVPGPVFFHLETMTGAPQGVEPSGHEVPVTPGMRAVLVAGIARPERFVAAAEQAGLTIADRQLYPDHHRFSADDIRRIWQACRDSRSQMVLTTEKDIVRLLPYRPFPVTVAWLPVAVTITPDAVFRGWLGERLGRSRGVH